MVNFKFPLLFAFVFLIQNCKEEKVVVPTQPLNVELLPTAATPTSLIVYKQNCWVEDGKFCIVGICSNPTPEWQKAWLEVVPVNAEGKPILISKHSSVIVPTFSDAVPPSGRTSFFATWPLTEFSGKPDSFNIKAMMSIHPAEGPILVTPMLSCMKMLVPTTEGQPANQETAWQAFSSVSNPLQMVASHPRIEVLVYGSDNRLYLSTVLNTEDPAMKPIFNFEGEGPLKPGETRPFTLQVHYQGLPKALQEKKIGMIEAMPFEARL